MKRAVKFILILFLSVSLGFSCSTPQQTNVLVITGVHKYNVEAFQAMFDSFSGIEYVIEETGEDPGALFSDPEGFQYDVIVMYNFRQRMEDSAKVNFMQLMDRGVGLVVLHHGLGGFYDWLQYEELIGATYLLEEQIRDGILLPRPTWQHGVEMEIEIADPGHPITRGVSDFTILDETYKGWGYHNGNHLLLSTSNENSNQQIAWTRAGANNRIFCMQLGHDEHAFEHPSYRKLLTNGIEWTAQNSSVSH